MPTAIPPKVRAIIYYIWLVLGLVLSGFQIYYLVTAAPTPVELKGVWAFFGAIGAGCAFTAASHVVINPPPTDASQIESGGGRPIG
jgi:Ni,Fe-hydrogenase I cytochrome b subunit